MQSYASGGGACRGTGYCGSGEVWRAGRRPTLASRPMQSAAGVTASLRRAATVAVASNTAEGDEGDKNNKGQEFADCRTGVVHLWGCICQGWDRLAAGRRGVVLGQECQAGEDGGLGWGWMGMGRGEGDGGEGL